MDQWAEENNSEDLVGKFETNPSDQSVDTLAESWFRIFLWSQLGVFDRATVGRFETGAYTDISHADDAAVSRDVNSSSSNQEQWATEKIDLILALGILANSYAIWNILE